MAACLVSGNGPDFEYYLPVIERTRKVLGTTGNLYVGDSHLGSSKNRLAILLANDYYLMPLNAKQCTRELLESYLDQIEVPVTELASVERQSEQVEKSAYFYEVDHKMEVDGHCWSERRILCYSPRYAKKQLMSFEERLDKAEEAIKTLVISKSGRRNPKTLADLNGRIAKITEKLKVGDCFNFTANQTITTYTVGRHKERSPETRQLVELHLKVERNEVVIEKQRLRKGWQLYASNAPSRQVSAADLVMKYRNQYRIEHTFDYAINRDTGLLPLFLKKENRIKGLIRLLMVAMRFSCLTQNIVREKLAEEGETIGDVYPGNKGRRTDKPTTPMILRAMRGVSAVFLQIDGIETAQLTDLTETQLKILSLSGASEAYAKFTKLLNSRKNMRET